MPRKESVVPSEVPTNVPLSNCTVGETAGAVGAAKVAAAYAAAKLRKLEANMVRVVAASLPLSLLGFYMRSL